MVPHSALLTGAVGLPLDFGAALISALNEELGDPVSRFATGAAGQGPKLSLEEHVDGLREQVSSSANFGSLRASFGVNAKERARVSENLHATFDGRASRLSWRSDSLSTENAMLTIAAASELFQIEQGGCSFGEMPMRRFGRRDYAIEQQFPQGRDQTLRWTKKDLLGIAPVQWFGSAFVEAFGGDSVFEALPDGWAEKLSLIHI